MKIRASVLPIPAAIANPAEKRIAFVERCSGHGFNHFLPDSLFNGKKDF